MKLTELKIKPPTGAHCYAIGHDIVGNTFVAIKTRGHVDYIYGMFKGRELCGGHLDAIESWHKEGEQVAFTDHPTKGNIVLVMGIPIKEITGPEADAIVEREKASAESANAGTQRGRDAEATNATETRSRPSLK